MLISVLKQSMIIVDPKLSEYIKHRLNTFFLKVCIYTSTPFTRWVGQIEYLN